MDSFYISLLTHLCSILDQLITEIPTSLLFPKPDDPVSFVETKAMQLANKCNDYTCNELEKLLLKSDEEVEGLNGYVTILTRLTRDFQDLQVSLGQGLQYCSYRDSVSYHSTIAEFRESVASIATKTRNKIHAFIDPIIAAEHEALKKEYGQPMAIPIAPYPPQTPLPEETLKTLREMMSYYSKDKGEALCLRFPTSTPTSTEVAT
jgi:hypothetical protein